MAICRLYGCRKHAVDYASYIWMINHKLNTNETVFHTFLFAEVLEDGVSQRHDTGTNTQL